MNDESLIRGVVQSHLPRAMDFLRISSCMKPDLSFDTRVCRGSPACYIPTQINNRFPRINFNPDINQIRPENYYTLSEFFCVNFNDKESLIKHMLVHELRHHKQHLDFEMVVVDGSFPFWHKKPVSTYKYRTMREYCLLPWEQQANNAANTYMLNL